jgi:hypothetical protein
MTVPRLDALIEYWEKDPPAAHSIDQIRRIVRDYYGIEDVKKEREKVTSDITKNDIIMAFAGISGVEIKNG